MLIYFMLQSDMPFGSWRESELEPFAKIAKGHLVMPSTFSIEVVDLITKVILSHYGLLFLIQRFVYYSPCQDFLLY